MRPLIVCCLSTAAPLIAAAATMKPALGDALLILAQAERPAQSPSPQAGSRGGASNRQILQSPMAQHMLENPDRQMMMDDPRFQALTQDPLMQRLMLNPQLQKQMQQDQQLRQLYQLQRRPLPGVSADDDD